MVFMLVCVKAQKGSSLFNKLKCKVILYRYELIITIISLGTGGFVANHVCRLGLTRILVDQNSHLNLARQAFDSLTPGLSQIGFWPPLLHVVMVPFVLIDGFYRTGLAGALTLIPFFTLTAVLIYKLCYLIAKHRFLSFCAAILFVLNPYILYYSVTPMMETLYLFNLVATAYFFVRWLRSMRLPDLIITGVFVSLATVSRFEGTLLVPLVSILVLARLILIKKRYMEIEALMIIFILPSVLGLASIMAQGYIFGDNPFAFLNSQWASFNITNDLLRPTQFSILGTLKYYLHASFHMLTRELVLIGLAGALLLLLLKPKLEAIGPLLILISASAFDYLAMFKGNAVLYVPELPPYDIFLNVRYGLYLVCFIVFSLAASIGVFLYRIKDKRFIYTLSKLFAHSLAIALLIFSIANFQKVAFQDNYRTVILEANDYPSKDQVRIAKALNRNYDFGKILMTRALHDFVAVDSGIPLRNFIHESNYKFYDQAIERPWLFARWVVTYNPDSRPKGDWSFRTEKISKKWTDSSVFNERYELVYENKRERLYKVKDSAIKSYAISRGYTNSKIPSINSQVDFWNPDKIYDELKADFKTDVKTYRLVKSNLSHFYSTYLKPAYQHGYFLDKNNIGTSEAQSYALLQSYWVGDKEVFDKVWAWTKKNLQRKEDKLFSWKFEHVPSDRRIIILDRNSATDADTDIAYALLKAGETWSNPDYIKEAQLIINSLWGAETAQLGEKRYVIAGNWANDDKYLVINPSYFSPLCYRLFAKYDKDHNWNSLISDGYELLFRVSSEELAGKPKEFLPVNWITLSKDGEHILPYEEKADSLDYSFDAFRVFWRVALDQIEFPNDEAITYLGRVTVFEREWRKDQHLQTEYGANAAKNSTNISSLTGPLSVFCVTNPSIASSAVKRYYIESGSLLKLDTMSFYDMSWYWFGLATWSKSCTARGVS